MSARSAFTLIEVLVSVVLISIVVLGIARIREQNVAAAHYLSSRMQKELDNTLFLGEGSIRYSGETKDAYTVLHGFGIKKDATREILKAKKREIRVSDPLPVGKLPFSIELRAIRLKDEYSSRYYRLFFQGDEASR